MRFEPRPASLRPLAHQAGGTKAPCPRSTCSEKSSAGVRSRSLSVAKPSRGPCRLSSAGLQPAMARSPIPPAPPPWCQGAEKAARSSGHLGPGQGATAAPPVAVSSPLATPGHQVPTWLWYQPLFSPRPCASGALPDSLLTAGLLPGSLGCPPASPTPTWGRSPAVVPAPSPAWALPDDPPSGRGVSLPDGAPPGPCARSGGSDYTCGLCLSTECPERP